MVKIRLRRPGKSIKGRTHQKIVVTEKSWARESKFIDQIGYYDPGRDLLKIDTDKYKQWIEKGAQPSDTVASLFKNYGKPKKVKKGKSFRPGEKQDYPKSAESGAEEQKEEVKEEQKQASEAKGEEKKAEDKEQQSEEPKEEPKQTSEAKGGEEKAATEGSPDQSVGKETKEEKSDQGKKDVESKEGKKEKEDSK